MKYYDTHCHLSSEPLLESVESILETCKQKNVIVNNIGTDINTSRICVEQSKKHLDCYAVVGVHPSEINDPDEDIKIIKELAVNNKVVAIGETGFDFYYKPYDFAKQEKSFINHIKLAQELKLPLVVHTRIAGEETYNLLKKYIKPEDKVLIHCFSGNKQELEQYLSLGCYISISGIITFKKADELRELLKIIPLDKMVAETDAPYLAPVPYRGTDCKPYYVIETIKAIATCLNIDLDKMADTLFYNSIKLFNI
ncbi:MAG: TatD family hydrolase [Mycoplasmoidaceae bacterium]|nr:TatD family hydrolase [Mycoplasmoidaceae bacterium]